MPRLSDSMREGAIAQWLVADGDSVTVGQELLEIETDKATMTYEAEDAGVIYLLMEPGVTVPVGTTIASIGGPDRPREVVVRSESSPEPEVSAAEAARAERNPRETEGRPAGLSPLLRRLARELEVDLQTLTGTGPAGRILRSDIEAAGRTAESPAPNGLAAPAGGTRTPLSHGERLIARRMTEFKHAAPDFSASITVDVTRLMALREELRELGGPPPTVNDFVVCACVVALREHPRLNSYFDDDERVEHAEIGIGIALATTAEHSLLVPTLHGAEEMDVLEIAAQTRKIVELGRTGALTASQLEGGSFTVSNLGAYGIRSFVPILNGRQAAILGVGVAVPTCVPMGGSVEIRTLMELTLNCDHRIVYGADAAQFLQALQAQLQNPLALLLPPSAQSKDHHAVSG